MKYHVSLLKLTATKGLEPLANLSVEFLCLRHVRARYVAKVNVRLYGVSGKGTAATDYSSRHGRLIPLWQGHQTQALQREVSHLYL